MPKNIAITMIERLDKLEAAQEQLATEKAAELVEAGINVTAQDVLKQAVTAAVNGEKPTGLCNGVNTSFTLARTPILGSEEIFLSGVRILAGTANDYTLSGNTITMVYAPRANETLRVNYDYIPT
jgi:hypothetical protein